MDAFAVAIAALFADRNMARDALWRAGGEGPAVLVRVIPRAPDREASWSDTRVIVDTISLELSAAQIPDLRGGDTVEIVGGAVLRVRGEPARDARRLVWTAEAGPA